MRATAVLPYAAQTEWSATATLPLGPPETRIGPARPRNVVVTTLKDGVMRSRSPRAPSATQTESLPVATPVGVEPSGNVDDTARLPASMRERVLSSSLPTQTDPEPTARLAGRMPTGTWPTTSFDFGSMIPTAFAVTRMGPEPPKMSTPAMTAAARTATTGPKTRSRSRRVRRVGSAVRRRGNFDGRSGAATWYR